jgi:hypothetical protein
MTRVHLGHISLRRVGKSRASPGRRRRNRSPIVPTSRLFRPRRAWPWGTGVSVMPAGPMARPCLQRRATTSNLDRGRCGLAPRTTSDCSDLLAGDPLEPQAIQKQDRNNHDVGTIGVVPTSERRRFRYTHPAGLPVEIVVVRRGLPSGHGRAHLVAGADHIQAFPSALPSASVDRWQPRLSGGGGRRAGICDRRERHPQRPRRLVEASDSRTAASAGFG